MRARSPCATKRGPTRAFSITPLASGAEVRAENYLQVFPKTILAVVPATLTGPQRLIIRRRPRPTQRQPTQFTYDTVLLPA